MGWLRNGSMANDQTLISWARGVWLGEASQNRSHVLISLIDHEGLRWVVSYGRCLNGLLLGWINGVSGIPHPPGVIPDES